MEKFKMIDISRHNGKMNWPKVKADGVKFVMIRAGFGWGFEEDLNFRQNVRECEAQNIPYGLYMYSYATTMDQARVEVAGFIKAIKGLKPSLPIVIDTEDADQWRRNNGNPGWKTLADMAVMQLGEIEKAGYYAMWYANLYWTTKLLQANKSLKKYDLWLAHWNPTMGRVDTSVGIWQYTSSGPKYGDGIDTCDMNWAYKNYPEIINEAGLNGFGKSTQNRTGNQLVVDGIWGELTTKALQKALGVEEDGIIGVETTKALQKALNEGRI